MANLIYMRGPPGVGKSHLVKEMQSRYKIPVIDYDDLKPLLSNNVSKEDLRSLPYDMARNCVRTILEGNVDVIFDSTGLWKKEFDAYKNEFGNNHNITVVRCTCSNEDLWKKRILGRESKETQVGDFDQAKKWFDLEQDINYVNVIEIDTSNSIEDNIKELVSKLEL